jgi:outer membrane protein TolC
MGSTPCARRDPHGLSQLPDRFNRYNPQVAHSPAVTLPFLREAGDLFSRGGRLTVLGKLQRPALGLALTLAAGCSHPGGPAPQAPAERILPPPGTVAAPGPAESLPDPGGHWRPAPETPAPTGQMPPSPGTVSQPVVVDRVPCQPLTLPDAIALAFEFQPRLRASLESIAQARGREDIAFAAFLPVLTTAYSVGGFDLNVGGAGLPLPNFPSSPAFTFVPFTGSLPVGLDIRTGYELAELKLQWLVCDFGRRLGRYRQADLAVDIAQLQTDRAYQTVANDVAVAYYQVLRARSLHRVATESVRRAEDDLDVARKLERGGAVEREKVLRAETALAEARRALDTAEEAEGIAVAALNLAVGLNVSSDTRVVDAADVPPFALTLADCLQAAVTGRRELRVAREAVQVAQEGSRVARADFAPKVVAEGYLNDFEQSAPRGHADLALGFIRLEWGLFEGGKRVAELRVAESKIRESAAEADAIADTIAFQVNQAYRQMVAARKGIDRSRPPVEQTRETYRLVMARSRQGDATPAEVTDAETALTRAEQEYTNAVYDYLTALARLEYAIGAAPTPTSARTPPAGGNCGPINPGDWHSAERAVE